MTKAVCDCGLVFCQFPQCDIKTKIANMDRRLRTEKLSDRDRRIVEREVKKLTKQIRADCAIPDFLKRAA